MYFSHLSSSSARAGVLKERSACAESLEEICAAQENLLQKKDKTLEQVRAEAERLRHELGAESQRLAIAKETFEAEAATATANAETQAATRALESADSTARLRHSSAEINTLKVRWRLTLVVVLDRCRDRMWWQGK